MSQLGDKVEEAISSADRNGYRGEIPFGQPSCPNVGEVGLATVLHWLASHRWIHRRSESMSFEDSSLGRRTLHVSFTVPDHSPRFDIDGEDYCCLPVSLLRKQKVNLFSMVDEEGVERPLLSRQTRGEIAAEGLVKLGAALTATLGQELPSDLEADIRKAASGGPKVAVDAMRRIEEKKLVTDPVSAACRSFLMGYGVFRLMIWSLTLNSMILVRMPCRPGAPKSLTASYDEPLNEVPPGTGLARTARIAFRTMGLTPKKLWYPARVLAAPSSNHYRVTAPDGLQVSGATLAVAALESPSSRQPDSSAPQPGEDAIGSSDRWEERDKETGAMGGVHLYDRDLPEQTVALVRVNLRPTASGTLRAIWLTSAIALGLLAITGAHLETLHSQGAGLTAAQSASALLLLIPTLLAVYVTRPGEHTFTSELLMGTRMLGLVAGGTTMLGACYLVLTDAERDLGGNWTLLQIVSGAVFVLLSASSLINWLMKYPEEGSRTNSGKLAKVKGKSWFWLRRKLG